ncbi:MAG: tetratricopeptide repeat protein [Pseudomonadota bacterium]
MNVDLFTQHPALKRLLWVLQHNQDFGLYFARCNVPNYRKQLVAAVVAQYPAVIEISLHQLEANLETIALDVALAEYLQDKSPEAAVFLYDLESRLPTEDTELQYRTLQQVNWRRSAYVRLQRRLVIWLPDDALRILARGAPDFFDWYSGVYEFEIPERAVNLSTFYDDDGGNHLTLAEKRRWKKVLLSLLDETKPDTPGGLQSLANLLMDLGRLHRSLGEYKQALVYFQQLLDIYQQLGQFKSKAIVLKHVAGIYYAQGDYDAALEYLTDALKILGNQAGLSSILFHKGLIYWAKGNETEAKTEWLSAYKIAKQVGDAETLKALDKLGRRLGSRSPRFILDDSEEKNMLKKGTLQK